MYGVPADLDLFSFLGASLVQIGLGEAHVRFVFHPLAEIGVEGRWELRDGAGRLLDHSQANADREAYRLHRLLGRQVSGTVVNPPESITLEFDGGYRLQLYDSSTEFESFTIQPGNIVV